MPAADQVERPPGAPANGLASKLVACAVVSSSLFGYSICVLNSCGDLIAVTFQWCDNSWDAGCARGRSYQGLVSASVYLGAACGALAAGRPMLSKLGARRQLVVSDLLWCVGALACAAANGVETLVLGRLASGVGLGISAIAAPLYIAEVSPRERRGRHSAMHGVLITVGILASIAVGIPQGAPPSGPGERLAALDSWYWRVMLALPLPLAAAQALLLGLVLPVDPPSLLVRQGEVGRAREVLYRLHGLRAPGAVQEGSSGAVLLALEAQLKELAEASRAAALLPRIRVSQAMVDPFLRTAVLLGLGLAAFQQLSGINGLMAYSNNLFAEAGIRPAMLTLASTAMAAANVCASALSSSVVDRWGRRRLLMTGSLIQTLAMACLAICLSPAGDRLLPPGVQGPLAVLLFTVFVMSFSFGLGAVTWLYLSEIYPLEIRGSSLSACGVVNWLCSFVVVFGTKFLSLREACQTFGLVCLAGFVGTALWVVETKGCSMDDSPLTPKEGRLSSPLLTPPKGPLGAPVEVGSWGLCQEVLKLP